MEGLIDWLPGRIPADDTTQHRRTATTGSRT